MKKFILNLSLIIIVIFSAVNLASAQSQATKGNFGLGVMFGEPTGLSGKLWTSHTNALDFGLAWSFINDNSITMTSDYLFHQYNLLKVDQGSLPFYYGIGGRLLLGNQAKLGVRIPVGLNYLFANDPIGVFFEVAPVLDLVPSTRFDVNGGIGIRYYFGMK